MKEMQHSRFECHSHTDISNLKFLDSINQIEPLIDQAIKIGLAGIAITEHESLSGSIRINKYAKKIHEKYPNFKIAIGNEIYLCETRESRQKYYHFILIAKNADGHRALRELSSRACINSYYDRKIERTVTLYSDLEEVLQKYPNTLIATTACLGGELSTNVLKLIEGEKVGNVQIAQEAHDNIVRFLLWCKKLFGSDFYIECAPACSKEQIAVNKRLVPISKAFDLKMVIGSDAHYLTPAERAIHKAFLTSSDGDREVDSFYEYAYLQTNEEEIENLKKSDFIEKFIEQMFDNSIEMANKIEDYSLLKPQHVSRVDINYSPNSDLYDDTKDKYPNLYNLTKSENNYDRYWINECTKKLKEKKLYNDIYLARLEEEARTKINMGKKLNTNVISYPLVLQHYIDLIWECGSPIGAGRGSSCAGLNHYLLGVTQLDPIKWELPWFRYMNDERAEMPDIDIDLAPSKRPLVVEKIREERRHMFNDDLEDIYKDVLGCTYVTTFTTATAKAAIKIACRGFRSEEFPEGIDVDVATYLSSLVPVTRGFVWTLQDMLYGNTEKERKPVTTFINEMKEYPPELLELMLYIQGLISGKGVHASGVIFFEDDPYDHCCFMRSPKGEVCTQYDLHDAEDASCVKFDFLVTDIQDKLAECIKFLQKYKKLPIDKKLREVYDMYLHPDVLDVENKKVWDKIDENKILNLFQFDSPIGSQGIKKLQPKTMKELADTNGLIRLMAEEGENPIEKYARFKKNISLWYEEMNNYGLTKEEQKVLEPYYLPSYGVPPDQEFMMLVLMDKNVCGFSLKEANAARKVVAKKQMSKIPELRQLVMEKASSPAMGKYIWDCGVSYELGYAFSRIHALAYSFIGYQTAVMATQFSSIYWNTSCLIVNSGSLEDNEKGCDYSKTAKALNDIIENGANVALVDINESEYSFVPNEEENTIMFCLNALSYLNSQKINSIIENRPYLSIGDFMNKVSLDKPAMISLIKAGAFDKVDSSWANPNYPTRYSTMSYYLNRIAETKKRITMQNFNELMKRQMLPKNEIFDICQRTFIINKELKKRADSEKKNYCIPLASISPQSILYKLMTEDDYSIEYENMIIPIINWKKAYDKQMEKAKIWILENHDNILNDLNKKIIDDLWAQYGEGTISAWEMEAICFYYSPHELINVNKKKYGISNFFELPEIPIVEKWWNKGKNMIPIFELTRIAGTVISKDDNRHSISLLTIDGVVTVKFTKDYYAMFKKQLSEKQEDGSKKIVERGWFKRGTKLLITGFRRDDTFVAKTYAKTNSHQLYKIENINEYGILELVHERFDGE